MSVIVVTATAATSLEVLPNEILCQIFEHLPVMWQLVCRHVCQRWRHLLLAIPTKQWLSLGSHIM